MLQLINEDGLLWAVSDESVVRALSPVALRACAFQFMNICPPSGEVKNAQSFNGEATHFPHEQRLAGVFLQQLGRTDERAELVEGVPDVVLETPLSDMDPRRAVALSASTVNAAVFGDGAWQTDVAELQRCEKSTRVVLSADLPPRFYSALMELSTNPRHAEFFGTFRSVPLCKLAHPSSRAGVLAMLELRLADSNDDLKKLADTDLWERYVADTAIHNSVRGINYLTSPASTLDSSICETSLFLKRVSASPSDFGFRTRAHLGRTLSLSLTELCTGVCVSQEGYYFVDGTGSTMNQLAPLTPDPVVFLSAPGLDFCTPSTTRLEMPKYFEAIEGVPDTADLKMRWKGFREGGEFELRARVKSLYRVVLASARLQGVRNPSMLPMGLGVFLYNVNKADHDGVRGAYFRAQYELLTEEDWGFETYWLNPAQHRGFAEELLRDGIAKGAFKPRCNIVLHNRDAKFLAVEMAKERMRPGVLNPSDCIAVMQGLIGYYWEIGQGDRYVGEEDFAATGTGILARCGISDVYTDLRRIVQVVNGEEEALQVGSSGVEVVTHGDYFAIVGVSTAWGVDDLACVASRALPFSRMQVLNASGQKFNAGSFDDDFFPTAIRPSAVFLELLGRNPDRYPVVEGVPHVALQTPLCDLPSQDVLYLTAAAMARFCDEHTDPSVIFGSEAFTISVGEVQRLERTTRVAVSSELPAAFYAKLCLLTTDPQHVKFFSYLRSVPLEALCSEAQWDAVISFEKLRNAEGAAELLALSEADKWDRYVADTAVRNSQLQMDFLTDRAASGELRASAAAWDKTLQELRRYPRRFGFSSASHLGRTLSLSLTELCTGVCVSQEGYYFVDGTGSTMNQLAPLTPDPVVFLSAPGLDFCTPSTTRLEMPKYFEAIEGVPDTADLKMRWKGFREGGEFELRARVKSLYRVVLTSARLQGVRNPSMLPMGLGVFLYNVNKADHDGVRGAYFRAQYELLTEEDWGFETYWLNPAQHRGFAEELLRDGIAKGTFKPRCNIVLHNRDAKFLAVEMAKERMRPGVLNPSDCIAVMQGLIGYYWEIGQGDRYVGEEDFAATGTGILARCGISDVYTDVRRIVPVVTGSGEDEDRVVPKEVSLDGLATWAVDNTVPHDVAMRSASFQYCNIRSPGSEAVYNAATFVKERQFSNTKRLSCVFLELLGRVRDREHVVEGVPNVALEVPLRRQRDATLVRLDAAVIDKLSSEGVPSGMELYGDGSFCVSVKELKRLEDTTMVTLASPIPVLFYSRLCEYTTKREYAEFFSVLRSIPLARLCDRREWEGIVRREEVRRTAAAERVTKFRAELQEKESAGEGRSVDDIAWDLYIEETATNNASRIVEFLSEAVHDTGVVAAWEYCLTTFRNDPLRFGFASSLHLETILSDSLTELCTGVCVSQEGYYFVDGTGSTMNQLAPLTPDPVVFLSAPGLDFCTPSTTRLEMPKYFEAIEGVPDTADLKMRWKGFREGGEFELRARVKSLYRVVLTSARLQGVRNPSMLPMGLGVFLYNVNKADHDGVRGAYFRAQYELLTEEDWGFETYWLNPAQHRGFAEELLRDGIAKGAFKPRCNIVLHNRDAKFLAVEMAKERMRPGVLNPSDCIAVMQGLIGYYWEIGQGDRYVGEEDFAATGTGILARCGISDVYTDVARIRQVEETVVEDREAQEEVESDEGEPDGEWMDFTETLSLETIFAAVAHVADLTRRGVGQAVRDNLKERIRSFISARPALFSEKGTDDRTLMYICCAAGDLELAKLFHQMGCPLCEKGTFLIDTPLHGAALYCHTDVIIWLILNGHPLNTLNTQGMDVFSCALATTGFAHCSGKTAEQAALCFQLLQATPTAADLKLLEESGARGEREDDTARWTRQMRAGVYPDLHVAVLCGDRPGVIENILRSAKQGDHTCQQMLDAQDPGGMTALHWAVITENMHAVRALLGAADASMRAKIDVQGRDGWTPLHWAVLLGRLDCVELLLTQNAERIKPLDLNPHVVFLDSVWEDAADPSRYVMRVKSEILHAKKKDLLGLWVREKQGGDVYLHRLYNATHASKDGVEEAVTLKVMLKLTTDQRQEQMFFVCLMQSDAVVWWAVYNPRTGMVQRRCRGWVATCDSQGAGVRCTVCGCRDVLVAGLRPSLALQRVIRGKQSGTALHAACRAAMKAPPVLNLASYCHGAVAEEIALKLLGAESRLKNPAHKRFVLSLDSNGDTAFSIIVCGLKSELRRIRGESFLRRFWGAPNNLGVSGAEPGVTLVQDEAFSTEGCPAECVAVCRTALLLSEQTVPHQLVVTCTKFQHVCGVYERREYAGTNGWPEYRYVTAKGRVHVLKSDSRGRWVIVRGGGEKAGPEAASATSVVESLVHGGRLPQYVEKWYACSAQADGPQVPVELTVSLDTGTLDTPVGLPTIPQEHLKMGWLMTLRYRCSETVAISFLRALRKSCADVGEHTNYAMLNTAAMPGSKGDGDPRLLRDCLSLVRAAAKEWEEGDTNDDDLSAPFRTDKDAALGSLLATALHCSAIFGRKLTIRCLLDECDALVTPQHLKTSVEWERWEEAKVLLDQLRDMSLDSRLRPFTMFTNGGHHDASVCYEELPSLGELKFCDENDVAVPSAYTDLLACHLALLKRMQATRWSEAPAEQQEVLRYLLSVRVVDYAELLRDPENRKSLDGYDFGTTPRSAELYLGLAAALSRSEIASVSVKGKALPPEWFPNGFGLAGFTVEACDYTALRYPLHVLLVKSSARLDDGADSQEDLIEFRKKCRTLTLECIRLVNSSAEKGEQEDYIELAAQVPTSTIPLKVKVVPTHFNYFLKMLKQSRRIRNERRSLDMSASVMDAAAPPPKKAAGASKVGLLRRAIAKPKMSTKHSAKYEDLSAPQWRMLPIELAIELDLVDVLEAILKGGVVCSDSVVKCRCSSGDVVKFKAYRDIWYPSSAEFIDTQQPGESQEFNWNRFPTYDSPPLLHRTLEKLAVPLQLGNVEAMHGARLLHTFESPNVPHLPPGKGVISALYGDSEESTAGGARVAFGKEEMDRRAMVRLLLQSSLLHRRDYFVQSQSSVIGEYKPVEKAELVNSKAFAPAASDSVTERAPSMSLVDASISSVVRSMTMHAKGEGQTSPSKSAPVRRPRAPQDGVPRDRIKEAELSLIVHHIGPYFDRSGVFASGAKKWCDAALAAAAAAVCGALITPAVCAVQNPYAFIACLAAMTSSRPRQRQPHELDASLSELTRRRRGMQVEFGLAKLLQRAPWVAYSAGPHAMFLQLLRCHPFISAGQLEKRVSTSSTPVYIERRHRWQRCLRPSEETPQAGGGDGLPYAVFDLEPPGEQDQLLDERLSLLHWLCALGDAEGLHIVTSELGEGVLRTRKGDGPQRRASGGSRDAAATSGGPDSAAAPSASAAGAATSAEKASDALASVAAVVVAELSAEPGASRSGLVPTRRSKLGFSPAHYVAYASSEACLGVLVRQAAAEAGDSGVKELLNYQVRCGCHQELPWALAGRDPSLHHPTIYSTTGDTPLMVASQFAHLTITRAFLEHGADTLLTNHEGLNCHDVAIALNYRYQCQLGVSGLSEKMYKLHSHSAVAEDVGEQDDMELVLGAYTSAEGDDSLPDFSPDTVKVLNRQITQLNANPPVRQKLESFARSKAFATGLWYILFLVLLTTLTLRLTMQERDSYSDTFWSSRSVSTYLQAVKGDDDHVSLPPSPLSPFIGRFRDLVRLSDLQSWLYSALPVMLLSRGVVYPSDLCFEGSVYGTFSLTGAVRLNVLRVRGSGCPRSDLTDACPPPLATPEAAGPRMCYGTFTSDTQGEYTPPNGTDLFARRWWSQDMYKYTTVQSRRVYTVSEGEVEDLSPGDPERLALLRKGEYLDPSVRLLSVLVTYYHPAENVVTVGVFHAELLSQGMVLPSVDVITMRVRRPYEDVTRLDVFFFICELLLFIYVVFFVCQEVAQVVGLCRRLLWRTFHLVRNNIVHNVLTPDPPPPRTRRDSGSCSHGIVVNVEEEAPVLPPSIQSKLKGAKNGAASPDNPPPASEARLRFASNVKVHLRSDTGSEASEEEVSGCLSSEFITQKTIEVIRQRTEREAETSDDDDERSQEDESSDDESQNNDGFSINMMDHTRFLEEAPAVPVASVRWHQTGACSCDACQTRKSPLESKLLKVRWVGGLVLAVIEVILKETLGYLFSSWNVVDILLASLLTFCVYLRVQVLVHSTNELVAAVAGGTSSVFHEEFVGIAQNFRTLNQTLGVVILLAYIKVLKLIVIVPKIGPVVRAIIKTMGDMKVLLFFLLYIEVLIAFVLGFHISFGSQVLQFHNVVQGIYHTLRIVLGDYPSTGGFDDLLVAHYALGPVFYLILLVFGQLLFLNILIAVISEVYTRAIVVTNRDWSKEISSMYQYSVCNRPDPEEEKLRSLLFMARRRNRLSCLGLSADDSRMKSPESHGLPWEVVSASTIAEDGVQRKSEQLSLCEVDETIERTSRHIFGQLRQHHEALEAIQAKLMVANDDSSVPAQQQLQPAGVHRRLSQ